MKIKLICLFTMKIKKMPEQKRLLKLKWKYSEQLLLTKDKNQLFSIFN